MSRASDWQITANERYSGDVSDETFGQHRLDIERACRQVVGLRKVGALRLSIGPILHRAGQRYSVLWPKETYPRPVGVGQLTEGAHSRFGKPVTQLGCPPTARDQATASSSPYRCSTDLKTHLSCQLVTDSVIIVGTSPEVQLRNILRLQVKEHFVDSLEICLFVILHHIPCLVLHGLLLLTPRRWFTNGIQVEMRRLHTIIQVICADTTLHNLVGVCCSQTFGYCGVWQSAGP